jgi:transposase-like protein
LSATNDSWRIDETFITIKGRSYSLWRAIDSSGFMLDFLLTAKHDTKAAKRFLSKVLQREHVEQMPRVINTGKYAVYPGAIKDLQESSELPEACEDRRVKCLNNILEQDHQFVKLKVKAGLGFQNFWSVSCTIKGYETMKAIRKGQVVGVERDIRSQNHFISEIFGVAV